MAERYGDWTDWLLCLGATVLLGVSLSDMGGRQFHRTRKGAHPAELDVSQPNVQANPAPETHKSVLEVSDRIALCLATIFGIGLFLEEKTPFFVATLLVFLFLCGAYILWHLIRALPWVRQRKTMSSRFIVSFVVVVLAWVWAVTAYGMKKWPTRHYLIEVIFKESPKWTPSRKQAMLNQLDDFYSYLRDIGFVFPRKIPPIALMRGNAVLPGGSWSGGQLYQSIILPEDNDADADAALIVQAYSTFIFHGYLMWDDAAVGKQFGGGSSAIFGCYYASSFLHRNMCPPEAQWPMETRRWTDALWEIRSNYGQDYSDRIMFYTFSMWNTSVTKSENFDKFFFNKVFAGETVIDSYPEAFTKVQDILSAHGIVVQVN